MARQRTDPEHDTERDKPAAVAVVKASDSAGVWAELVPGLTLQVPGMLPALARTGTSRAMQADGRRWRRHSRGGGVLDVKKDSQGEFCSH